MPLQAQQRAVQQGVEIGGAGELLQRGAQRRQPVVPRQRAGRTPGAQRLDRLHLVDIRAQQAEHFGHAGVRGDARQHGLHLLEQRALRFGAQVAHRQPEVRAAVRVDHLHHGVGIDEDVLAGLVEKLERQRHVAFVDVIHLRDQGDVGRAVGRHGGDHRRDHALQAAAQRVQVDAVVHAGSFWPACGPGVWLYAVCGVKRMAVSSVSDGGISEPVNAAG